MNRFFVLFIVFIMITTTAFGETIKDFELSIYGQEGKTFKLSKELKSKKILINFWATWCTSCIQEVPILEKLQKDHPESLFVAINAGDNVKKIKKFLDKYNFTYIILLDKDKKYSKSVGVLSLPQTFVVGEKLEILYKGNIPPERI